MTIQAAYYSTFAVDSLRGIHASSAQPVYKLAFMTPAFRYNTLNTRWQDIDWREISPSGKPNLQGNEIPYPKGGYEIEMFASMIDGKFRLYPRNQSSITTLINYGFQSGWDFKTLVLYESKSGSLVFAFNAFEAISGDYGGRFLKPRYVESNEVWNAGPPLISSDLPPETSGTIEFLKGAALPPYIYDGEVRGIVPGDDGSYYLAGTFTKMAEGRYAGRGAFDLVDSETGFKRSTRFKVSGGSVRHIMSDGTGGLFILGDFTQAGDLSRDCICKYTPDFEVDSSWNINVNITGVILTGGVTDQFLYVGGDFDIVYSGTTYSNLVRFNLENGSLDVEWKPNPSINVRTIKIHTETSSNEFSSAANKILYVGGGFTTIKSFDPSTSLYVTYSKKYLARFNMGELDDPPELDLDWGPTLNNGGHVHVIETDENHVYVGGAFTIASSMTRRRILRAHHTLNPYLGLDTSWSANWGDGYVNSKNFIRSFAFYGDYIFASARSDNLSDRNSSIRTLGAFSIKNSSVLNFFPIFQNGAGLSQIWNMSIHNNTLYCVGSFQSVNGEDRQGAVSFDLSNEIPTILPWTVAVNKSGPLLTGEISLYPINLGVFLGGNDLSPIIFRNGLCRINSDGKIDSWNPIVDSTPKFSCIERHGGFVYVGFSADNSTPQPGLQRLVRISEDTGAFSSTWPGGSIGASGTGNVLFLKVNEGKLYVGSTGLIGGQKYIARFSLGEQITQDLWNPNIEHVSSRGVETGTGFVNGFDIKDDNVCLSGKFTRTGGFEREGFSIISALTGETKEAIGDLSPIIAGDGISNRYPVVLGDDGAYVAGSFTSVKRGSSAILTGIDEEDIDISNNLRTDGKVMTITPDGSGGFYIGGTFTKILGKKRNRIAHIDSTLSLTDWSPNINGQVNKIYKYDNYIYVVGSFTQINDISRLRSARFIIQEDDIVLDTGYITNFSGGNAQVRAVVSDGNWVYYGLDDSYLTSYSKRYVKLNGFSLNAHRGLVRVSSATGLLDIQWACKVWLSIPSYYRRVGFVNDITLNSDSSKIYICGLYNNAFDSSSNGGSLYGNASCFSTANGGSIIQQWTVSIPTHPYRNIDYNRLSNRTLPLRESTGKGIVLFRVLNSIKIYGGHVYVAGAPFLWGTSTSKHRSSRIARFPIEQNGSNFGLADTSFRLSYEGDSRIVSLVSNENREHRQNFGTSIEFDLEGNIHFSSSNFNIGVFNPVQKTFSYTPFDGYLKLNGQSGEIKYFFDQKTSYPVHTTSIFKDNFMVAGSQSPDAWDVFTSIAHIGNDGKIRKIFPNFNGTTDIKMSIFKDGRWLYAISNNRFDSSINKDKYFIVCNLNEENISVPKKSKSLVLSAPSGAKSLAKVGDYIVIAGSEMTRDPAAKNDTVWGDFIDHGVSGGRKVVYYKITESP